MKKLSSLLSTLTFKNAGCSKSLFDPLFAQVLQERGYVADANNITLEEVRGITELDVSGKWVPKGRYVGKKGRYVGKLTSLKGIEYFESLTSLCCDGNRLTSLDVSKNTALTKLWCVGNQLTALDVSKNTALKILVCCSCRLTALDVSNNTALTSLSCDGNQLKTLDVSRNIALTYLDCGGNRLTALDVSKNTALTYLICDGNRLTTLDVSKNTALIGLYCKYNPGDGTVFPVTAWFDNNAIPLGFTAGSWDYGGTTITIDYRKAE